MTLERLDLGRKAEDAACDHLRRHRHQILATNFRSRVGEIDIVSSQGETIVFVEVRSRTGSRFGTGIETVDYRKRRRLCRAAEAFLLQNRIVGRRIRFDVIGVEWGADGATIDHVENAFECE